MSQENIQTVFSTLGKKHVVIPDTMAEALNFGDGDMVVWMVEGGNLVLKKVWNEN